MNVYPIMPNTRIQARIRKVLSDALGSLDAFDGAVFVDDRTTAEETIPWICVRVVGAEEMPPRSNYWHLQVVVQMCEDRMEQRTAITGNADTRPRHDHRCENLTALIHGVWEDSTFMDKINDEATLPGAAALRLYGANFATETDGEDRIMTEYSFSLLCVSTEA